MDTNSPLAAVQVQLDAYNARDVDALVQIYAPEAQLFSLHGELLASGRDQLRSRYLARFAEPHLQARLLSRIASIVRARCGWTNHNRSSIRRRSLPSAATADR